MKLSAAGEALIKAFEGYWATVKLDEVGIPTGGWGHTNLDNVLPVIHMGDTHDVAFWEQAFKNDMEKFEGRSSTLGLELTQPQFDALVSFDFNTGKLLSKSCSVLPKIRAGDLSGAMHSLLLYTHGTVHGKLVEFAGLVRRRKAEALMFQGDVQGSLKLAEAHVPSPITKLVRPGDPV